MDPFAETYESAPSGSSPWDEPSPPPAAADGGSRVSITLKGGGQPPWMVLHANNVRDADALLTEAFATGLSDKVEKAAARFATTSSASAPGKASGSNPPGVPTQTCTHGGQTFTRNYKTGPKKQGGEWKAWMCGAPQDISGGQCDPIWV